MPRAQLSKGVLETSDVHRMRFRKEVWPRADSVSERGEAGVRESFQTLLIDPFNREEVPCTLVINARWYRPKKNGWNVASEAHNLVRTTEYKLTCKLRGHPVKRKRPGATKASSSLKDRRSALELDAEVCPTQTDTLGHT